MAQKKVITDAFTEMAPQYEQKVSRELNHFWGVDYSEFVDQLIKLAHARAGDTVLDLATGTAVIPRKLIDNGIDLEALHGLDLTPAMLLKAQKLLEEVPSRQQVRLTCGSAMELPYQRGSFDLVLCGLATHHMKMPQFISEIYRVLKKGGRLAIADVGGSPILQFPIIHQAINLAAFIYFLPREGLARARSEATALSNVLSADEWKEALAYNGFSAINILHLSAKHSWIPAPLIIQATKIVAEA
jgi:ubiquinone/menaquinone biosynthesis C-methylase UbiE